MKGTFNEHKNLDMLAGNNPDTNDIGACVAWEPNGQYPMTFTKFELSPEEVQRVMSTGVLWLGVMGVGMPPVMPTVYDPVNEQGFTPASDVEINEMLHR